MSNYSLSGNFRGELFIALAAVLIFVLAYYVLKIIKQFRFFRSLPQDKNFSFIWGNLQNFPKGDNEAQVAYGMSKVTNMNPKFNCTWIGLFKPLILVYHPDSVKKILKSSAPKSRGFGQTYDFFVPWIGEGLVAANGPAWHRSRQLLTPAFHFDILKTYVDASNEAAERFIKRLETFANSGKELDVYPMLHGCTLEVILKCAFSCEADGLGENKHPYAEATGKINEIFTLRQLRPWYWPTCIFKLSEMGRVFFQSCDFVHSVADKVIHKRKSELLNMNGDLKKTGDRKLDFIDILLNARDDEGNAMSNLEIRNEVDTVMFAGHDTTAVSTMWLLYCLAKNPDYQTKVQEEVDAILKDRDSDDILWNDLSELSQLTLCVKESMRLYPPVPFIERELDEDTTVDGQIIPRGTHILVAILFLHRHPMVWEDPDDFRPERFTSEQRKGRDTFSYVPFSAGPRNCIGQNFAMNEVKILASRLMRKYSVELVPGRPAPIRYPQVTLQSENGMWLKFKPRTQCLNV